MLYSKTKNCERCGEKTDDVQMMQFGPYRWLCTKCINEVLKEKEQKEL